MALCSMGCGNIGSPRPSQDSRGGILIVDGGATPDHLVADLSPLQPDKGVTTDGWVPPADTQPLQASSVVLAITGMT
jgi:hypothetical protein